MLHADATRYPISRRSILGDRARNSLLTIIVSLSTRKQLNPHNNTNMSQSESNSGQKSLDPKFLHIKAIEVTFQGDRPHYPIYVKLKVKNEGKVRYKSPRFGRNDTVRWEIDDFLHLAVPTDFDVLVREVHTLYKKDYAVFSITAADVIDKEEFSTTDVKGRARVALTCVSVTPSADFAGFLAKEATKQVGNKKTLLESLGRASDVLAIFMKFTDLVSDVHPAAKAAVAVINVLYERCTLQEECHDAATELMKDLVSFLPLVKDIEQDITESGEARRTIKQMLELFCTISMFIIKYSSEGSLGGLLASHKGEIDSLTKEFKALKDTFDWRIKIETRKFAKDAAVNTENILLQQLRPAMDAYYTEDRCCLEGTRKDILGQIRAWADSESESKLFWLHGVAGSGKSCIANSVAHELKQQRRLFGCFFCKRDDPDCRIPKKVIPTLAHHFSKWHADYRSQMVSLMQGEEGLGIYSSLARQLELLVKKSMVSLSFGPEDRALMPLVIIIDALDECEDRFQLAQTLLQFTDDVPWVKVFITSRPSADLRRIFSKYENLDIDAKIEFDLQGGDIIQYTKFCAKMPKVINLTDNEVQTLAQMASGLFIWTSTAFKFINGQSDSDGAVGKVLLLKTEDSQESQLDQLYITIIKSVVDLEGVEGVHIISVILGVILSTSRNKPLPEDVLLHFLSAAEWNIDQEKLRVIVDSLQSVIYRDESNKGAIRVHHPSFLDFISDSSRSKLYWTESEALESSMARKCLKIMLSQLRFNICGLQSSLITNDELSVLDESFGKV
ncbi:hypothetical protein M0805_004754 [Coniferiporia weirii]|nr:hypothetical protein M0805_004754 [Coniferiporia weirii]